MSKGPVEIKAEDGHPGEHGQGREVYGVAKSQTSSEWDENEELVVDGGQVDTVVIQLNVEADDEEAGGEEDEEDVDADDFSLDKDILKYFLFDISIGFCLGISGNA